MKSVLLKGALKMKFRIGEVYKSSDGKNYKVLQMSKHFVKLAPIKNGVVCADESIIRELKINHMTKVQQIELEKIWGYGIKFLGRYRVKFLRACDMA